MSNTTGIPPSVSIIVPAFNEEAIISRCIEELDHSLRGPYHSPEIIVVNDGSTDRTLEVARSLQTKYPLLRVLNLDRNFGKATALKEGIRLAHSDTLAFFDADLQYDPADLAGLLSMLNGRTDVVTGLREFQHYATARTAFSKIYNTLLKLVFRVNVNDSNCGMKVLRREAANPDFLFRYGTPLMVPVLKLRGFHISEKPVALRDRKVGESKFFKSQSFLGGWKNLKTIFYNSVLLLGLFASLPLERPQSSHLITSVASPFAQH